MIYQQCIQQVIDSIPMTVECQKIIGSCFNQYTIVTREPFSFLQKETTILTDSCFGGIIKEITFYDLNHWFGTICILLICLALLIFMYLDDKKNG